MKNIQYEIISKTNDTSMANLDMPNTILLEYILVCEVNEKAMMVFKFFFTRSCFFYNTLSREQKSSKTKRMPYNVA